MAPAFSQPLVKLSPRAQSQLQAGQYGLLDEVSEVLANVSNLRNLPIKETVQLDIMGRDELYQKLNDQIQQDLLPDEIRGEQALYIRWGMLPENFNYLDFILGLYTEQIGGFYDPKTRQLFLLKNMGLSSMDQELLVAHELTHALQDQNFGLNQLMEKSKEANSDRQLAHMALIEGDATLTSTEYIAGLMQKKFNLLDMLGSFMNAVKMNISFEKLRQAPRFIRESMLFPYEQGLKFMQAFRKEGWSWEDMKVLYQNPPQSTEQILSPEKYLDGEKPLELKISDGLMKLQPKARRLTQGVLGELGWRQYFRHYLEPAEAKQASQGWGGDQYQVYELPDQRSRLGFFTVWDQPQEAQEFVQAYLQTLKKRYPEKSTIQTSAGDMLLQVQADDWIFISVKGARAMIFEGLARLSEAELTVLKQKAFPAS